MLHFLDLMCTYDLNIAEISLNTWLNVTQYADLINFYIVRLIIKLHRSTDKKAHVYRDINPDKSEGTNNIKQVQKRKRCNILSRRSLCRRLRLWSGFRGRLGCRLRCSLGLRLSSLRRFGLCCSSLRGNLYSIAMSNGSYHLDKWPLPSSHLSSC